MTSPEHVEASSQWVEARNGEIPEGALQGGQEAGGPLYVCRAYHGGGLHPGRIRPDFTGCHIGWGGYEVVIPVYEVLVAPAPDTTDEPCDSLVIAASNLVVAIPDWGRLFLNDDEKQLVRSTAREMRTLALRCGCLAAVDDVEKLKDLASENLPNREEVVSQIRKVKQTAKDCVDVDAPDKPNETCSQAAIKVYDLADTVSAGSSLFLEDAEIQIVRFVALEIRNLAIECECVALIDGADRIRDLASGFMPKRDEVIDQFQHMKRDAKDCLRAASSEGTNEVESQDESPQ
jgi:hypothetical protein